VTLMVVLSDERLKLPAGPEKEFGSHWGCPWNRNIKCNISLGKVAKGPCPVWCAHRINRRTLMCFCSIVVPVSTKNWFFALICRNAQISRVLYDQAFSAEDSSKPIAQYTLPCSQLRSYSRK